MKYYFIEPEVAGGFGEETVIDRSSGRMEVKVLHYKFEGWLGDELLESTPCFIASEQLAARIKDENLSGVGIDKVKVTKSDEFNDFHPEVELPNFVWLKVNGVPGGDDFGVTADLKLIVSEAALQLLTLNGVSHAASITLFHER
ncbi:hypothetical protein ACN9MJ_13105 [Acidovorax facilis]|uniref:hypothetical protein n=1 Tax=Acidovorax facilis TaxID=12917 RepID=UPI003CF6C8B5